MIYLHLHGFRDAEFKEEEHARGKGGRFTKKGEKFYHGTSSEWSEHIGKYGLQETGGSSNYRPNAIGAGLGGRGVYVTRYPQSAVVFAGSATNRARGFEPVLHEIEFPEGTHLDPDPPDNWHNIHRGVVKPEWIKRTLTEKDPDWHKQVRDAEWKEEEHARAPAGTSKAGQFVSQGKGGGAASPHTEPPDAKHLARETKPVPSAAPEGQQPWKPPQGNTCGLCALSAITGKSEKELWEKHGDRFSKGGINRNDLWQSLHEHGLTFGNMEFGLTFSNFREAKARTLNGLLEVAPKEGTYVVATKNHWLVLKDGDFVDEENYVKGRGWRSEAPVGPKSLVREVYKIIPKAPASDEGEIRRASRLSHYIHRSIGTTEEAQKKCRAVSRELGYPVSKVKVVDEYKPFKDGNGELWMTAGECNENTGNIKMFLGELEPETYKGMVAHEVMHGKVRTAMMNSNQPAIYMYQTHWQELTETGRGVSDYADSNWDEWDKDPKKFGDRAAMETLAEIARLKYEGTDRKFPKVWEDLYDLIQDAYDKAPKPYRKGDYDLR